MCLTVSTLSNILILKGQYVHTTLNAVFVFFFCHFASYFERMIKKEQDNGCNRSSKKMNLRCSDLTTCWKRTWQEHVCLTLPLLPSGFFFWGGTAYGSKRAVLSKLIIAKVQVRIWELTNTNILTNDSPNCYFCYWVFKDIREAVTTQGVCMYVYNKMHIDIHTYSMFAGSKIPRCCNKQLNHPQVIRLFSPCAQTTSPATTLKGDASGHSTGIAYVASYI